MQLASTVERNIMQFIPRLIIADRLDKLCSVKIQNNVHPHNARSLYMYRSQLFIPSGVSRLCSNLNHAWPWHRKHFTFLRLRVLVLCSEKYLRRNLWEDSVCNTSFPPVSRSVERNKWIKITLSASIFSAFTF